jgi:hypothetical protein
MTFDVTFMICMGFRCRCGLRFRVASMVRFFVT